MQWRIPAGFSIRAFSRLAGTESPLAGSSVANLLLEHLESADHVLSMITARSGYIPSRTDRHWITSQGRLFFLGLIVVILRYIKKRNWIDLFLLISIPLLMMPSILSLAFPAENPSLNRTGAAIIPVFVIAAMGIMSALGEHVETDEWKIRANDDRPAWNNPLHLDRDVEFPTGIQNLR